MTERIDIQKIKHVPAAELLCGTELSDWECYLFGAGPDGIAWRPQKDHVPNFFWRWMQYLCFGNKWVRGEESK